jgi:hypothetical protein
MKYSKSLAYLVCASVTLPLIALAQKELQIASLASDFRAKKAKCLRTREVAARPIFLTGTNAFSSTTCFSVYKDHANELTTVYDNPTYHDIDGMAVMGLYVHPTE